MVDADPRVEAELAYQRALAALHDARAELADATAAERRLAYDRVRLDPADALAREQVLRARVEEATAAAERLRRAAAHLREQARRLGQDAAAEPAELPENDGPGGFEQPPYPGTAG